MSTVKDVTYFFKFSPSRADYLEQFLLSKLEGTCHTMWVARTGSLNLFEDEFVSFVNALEFFSIHSESKVNMDTASRFQVLLNHLSNFPFIVTLVVTRKTFDFITLSQSFCRQNQMMLRLDLIILHL